MARAPVGRNSERERLLASLAMTRQGQGSVVLVEGEGGTGKSTLVASLLDDARAGEHHILHGRSWELSSAVPYESLVSAVSRHLRSRSPADVTRLTNGLPTLGALIDWLDLQPPNAAPEAFKVRAQDAFATLIARISADRPVVLALDDLHWADQASLEVLQYLCVDLPETAVLLVITVRPDEAERRPELRHLLAGLRREPWASTIELGRLDRPAIEAIITDHLGGSVTPRVHETVASRSGGTPLLIHELLDDLTERGVIVEDGSVWRIHGDVQPLTRSATDLIRSRLDRVEAADRAVLEALAVVNGSTQPATVASLLRIDIDAVEASLDRLRSIRLAVETERAVHGGPSVGWTVEHPVIAEVVETELVDAARRRLHRRLLDVDTEAPIGRRARHALLAGEPADRLATIALLADAGAAALALAAPSAAIDPLRGALSLLHPDDGHLRHTIERDLGTAYLRQLEVGPALHHLRAAWGRAELFGDVAARVELLHPLDDAEFRAGNRGMSAAALDALRTDIAGARAWELLVEVGWVHLSHAGRDQSTGELDNVEAALALIPADLMPERGQVLREVLSAYRDIGVVHEPAGVRVDRFLTAADQSDAHPDIARRFVLLAFDAAMLSGDPALVGRCRAHHRRIEERTGEPATWRIPMVEGFRSIAEGRLDERPADLRLHGAQTRTEVMAAVMRAFSARYTAGPHAAMMILAEDGEAALGANADRTAQLCAAFGRLLVAIGTPAEADAAASATAAIGGDRLLEPAASFVFGGATALAHGLAGDAATRRAAVAELDAVGAGRWLPSAWASVVRARQRISPTEQAAELVRAADILDGLGRSLEAAERIIDAAEVDLEGVTATRLGAALATARLAGASWLVGRAERLVPAARWSDRASVADGPLTSRELEVASLVADGLTNREIAGQLYISIRTVTSHLDHIYTKLALSSRDALSTWYRSSPR